MPFKHSLCSCTKFASKIVIGISHRKVTQFLLSWLEFVFMVIHSIGPYLSGFHWWKTSFHRNFQFPKQLWSNLNWKFTLEWRFSIHSSCFQRNYTWMSSLQIDLLGFPFIFGIIQLNAQTSQTKLVQNSYFHMLPRLPTMFVKTTITKSNFSL